MKSGTTRGFTIVEMLIVIVVIAILATITAVMYTNTQTQARDLQIRDAADKFADAVQLFAAKNGRLPRGGNGSTVAIGAGTECANGANNWVSPGAYSCTVEDTLVASGYLPAGFTSKLPQNTSYPASTTVNRSLVLWASGTSMAMVYYTLESPAASDLTHLNTELVRCGIDPSPGMVAPRDSQNMKDGICIQFR